MTKPAEVHPAYATALSVALDPRLRALMRLLVDEGHATPYARRMVEAVLDEHTVRPSRLEERRVPAPKMTRRARRALLLKRLRGEVDQP